MRILLINNSPVVGKLVTLSAQKTGDELVVVDSLRKVPAQEFNLLLIDDEFYSDAALEKITKKASFDKKVLIADRGTPTPSAFSVILEKPFLPTDLVEIILNINTGSNHSSKVNNESAFVDETLDYHDSLDSDDELMVTDGLIDELDSLDEGSDDFDIDLIDDNDPKVLDKNDISEVKELLEDENLSDDLGEDMDLSAELDLDEVEAALGGDDLEEDDLLGDALAESDGLDIDEDDDLLSDDEGSLGDDLLGGDDDLLGGDEDLLGETAEESAEELDLGDDDLLGGDEDLLGGDEDLLGEATEESAEELDLGDDLLGESADALGLDDLLDEENEEEITISGNDDLLSEMEEERLDVELDDDLLSDAQEMLGDDEDPLANEGEEIDLNSDDDLLGNSTEEIDDEDEEETKSDILGMGSTDDIINDLMGDEFDDEDDDLEALSQGISEMESNLAALESSDDEPALSVAGGEFASLTEEALSEALGESKHSDVPMDIPEMSQEESNDVKKKLSLDGNPEVLKMLLSTLDSDQLKEALKGMNISINISFDETH